MYKDILLPIDILHENSSKSTVDVAIDFAKSFGSVLHVMTVVPDSGMSMVSQYFSKNAVDQILDSTNAALHGFVSRNIPSEIEVQHIVTTGNVYESIIDTAVTIDADLIVMSSGRPELKDYLLGPNSARVVRHSNRSVLVVRDKNS